VKCLCCESSKVARVLYQKNGSTIRQCRDCGLGFAEKDDFHPESYYDDAYFDGSRADGYADYSGAREVLTEQFDRELQIIETFPRAPGAVLEIGCAYGYFIERALLQYTDVYGIEICQAAVAECHRRGLYSVTHGAISAETLEAVPEIGLAVMLDVIEHLPDPREALELVSGKMSVGGILFITTGDFASLASRVSGRYWRLMTPPQHLWFFTPLALEKLGRRLGLEVIHVSHPAKRVPLGLMVFQALRLVGVRARLPAWMHRVGLSVNLHDAMRLVLRKVSP